MLARGMLAGVAALGLVACGIPDEAELNGAGAVNSPLNTLGAGQLPAQHCRTVTVRPSVTGTIRQVPGLQLTDRTQGTDVLSTFSQTTTDNAEIRRGVVEFAIPNDGRIASSTLLFKDMHGWTANPAPADWHQLSWYAADGALDVNDFQREALPLATLSTDLNDLNARTRSFDVSGLVTGGSNLGFRLELQRVNTGSLGSAGSGFTDFRLELVVCGTSVPTDSPTSEPSGIR